MRRAVRYVEALPIEAAGAMGARGGVGAKSAATWLAARGAHPPTTQRWHVEIALDVVDALAPAEFDDKVATRFHIDVYSEEWGLFFCHAGNASWIRVTDIAFVHGRDHFNLLAVTPPLADVGKLLRTIEKQHAVNFQRQHATVRTNLPSSEPAVRAWIAKL